jgi:assimilatory nitrate reductase catalytic subunit
VYRGALLIDDRIEACVFMSPRQDLPSRTWLSSLFAKSRITGIDRNGLLMGQAPNAQADTGPVVCSCFGVGRKTICDAIAKQRLRTTAEVGAKLRAGTNCGSCVGEIRMLLADRLAAGAA